MASFFPGSNPHPGLIALVAAALAFPSGADAGVLSFKPGKLSFGSNALGESTQLSATLRNATATDVALLGAKLTGKAGAYSFSTTCGKVLKAGRRCDYQVKYTPRSLRANGAVLEVSTADPASPVVRLQLRGNLYGAINDTGVTACGDLGQNGLPCPIEGFEGQDAEQGRDARANHDADGHAGFSFTKLDSAGRALPASANSWDCVRDNVTGLMWEVKPKGDSVVGNQGLHDADDVYSWYSADSSNNDGFEGYRDQGNSCAGYDSAVPAAYCNTEAYAARVNAAGWCGVNDWRVPSVEELKGLVDVSVAAPGPAIDTGYFPDIGLATYWTSVPVAGNADFAWSVAFSHGSSNYARRSAGNALRLVRGGSRS